MTVDPAEPDWALGPIPSGDLIAEIWECDDDCGCSQAVICSWLRSDIGRGSVRIQAMWHGTYYIDHVYGEATAELNREARRLRKHHNELYHRISWPWDRKERTS